jgi:tetratricopeptide (TPR) repeat protein
LKIADQALEAARQASDTAGATLAQQARAKALQDLQRTQEALAAWQEAQQMWARSGDTPEQIRALVQAGLLSADNRTEAQRLFSQGLAVGKEETQRPAALAQALHDSGVALSAQGQRGAGWDYLNAALAMREKQTPESLQLVETLNTLAKLALTRKVPGISDVMRVSHDYSARALEISQRLAPDSSLVVESLRNLGKSYEEGNNPYLEGSNTSDANHASEHFLAALRIQTKLAPSGSIEQADILADLGAMEMVLTDFVTAHRYLEEAVALSERLAPGSMLLGKSLGALANLELQEGDLPSARGHSQRTLIIAENLNRANDVASGLISLGVIAGAQHDFASANDYFEKALAIFQKKWPNGMGVLVAQMDIAQNRYNQGDLASALEQFRRTITLVQKKLGDSVEVAAQLSEMGDILRDQGDLGSAADYYHKALEMRQKVAPESLHVANSLYDLAKLERARRNRSLAMEYGLRALQLSQKSCPDSSCVPEILNDLGELAYEQGDLARSEGYLRRAAEIREKDLGPTHPDLARSLNDLALTLAASRKRGPEALEMALRAENIGTEHLRVSVRTMSERQALAYEGIRASGLDLALTLTADRPNTASARRQVFDAVIHSRALVFDELAARHRSAYGSGDPEVTQLANQLASARAQLATLVFRGVGDGTPQAYRKFLDDARDRKEKAERALAEKSIVFRQDQAHLFTARRRSRGIRPIQQTRSPKSGGGQGGSRASSFVCGICAAGRGP